MSAKAAAVAKPAAKLRAAPAAEPGRIEQTALPMLDGAQRSPLGCACGGGCPRCQAAALQRKAQVSTPGDRFEREADEVADQVMRMARPSAIGNASPALQRKCTACEDENKESIQREAASNDSASLDPTTATQVAARGGAALSAELRDYFEPRFNHDFGAVRVHAGNDADQGARAVQARAYTVGPDIVFGSGEFAPHTDSGKRLLAHELTHVIQQSGGSATISRAPSPTDSTRPDRPPIEAAPAPLHLQRACKPAAACTAPIPGDPGRFGEKTAKDEAALRAASGPAPASGAPAPCSAPRHKDRATELTALVTGAGVTLPAEVHGIFINACLPASVGSQVDLCSSFPDGAPAGAPAALNCVQVHTGDEDDAKAIRAKTTRSAADNEAVLNLVSTMVHEAQHAHFDAKVSTLVPPGTAADCNIDTVVFHGPTPAPTGTDFPVSHYLSEMSAEIAEFVPFFQNTKSAPGTASSTALFDEERSIALNQDESISGILQALQCKCNCATVDTFAIKVFNDATGGWPADQKAEFQKAMTRILPAAWPTPLKKT